LVPSEKEEIRGRGGGAAQEIQGSRKRVNCAVAPIYGNPCRGLPFVKGVQEKLGVAIG